MNDIATTGRRLLTNGSERLFTIATGSYKSVLFLGSGARFGAAQEASLKMLEMSSGRIATRADTYLGVRHGPLSFVRPDTLIVCFISSDKRLRAYELDLVGELIAKGLGSSLVLVGVKIPSEMLRDDVISFSYELVETLTDNELSILDVVVGQLVGFFRCLHEGLKPDKPSPDNVITRVVRPFVIHAK
jgi:tagatose-6-phosphate ketose/aldose isomerase